MTAAASAAATPIAIVDPATGNRIASYTGSTPDDVERTLDAARRTFAVWSGSPFGDRSRILRKAAAYIRTHKTRLAELCTREMGKPIGEAEAEVEKCAVGCEYYADHAEAMLANEDAPSNASRSYVAYRPLGVLLAIMPWNYPFWQAFRAAAPALMAGNVVVLKHATNVSGCALAMEEIFREAGLPKGGFTTLLVSGSEMQGIVADPRIACVTLTGSEAAGAAVAATAGKHLKKTVLELGGSDAFIVLADADVAAAAKTAVKSRFQNAGQSCIAAKRFIVEAPVYDAFLDAFATETRALVVGDPMQRTTNVGPVARGDLRDDLAKQIDASVAMGARIVCGGQAVPGAGFFFAPTILADVTPAMPVFTEETFGPCAAVIRANDVAHAVELANDSCYGLGGNLWTADIARAESIAAHLESGAVFINGMTASDPRLPFGGVKKSGYGRELSHFGIREFVNIQTVWIG
jgi:succinate-semialdehyde dehydrogenase/glutarate-semialdehyde dehydrogenase